MPWAKIIVFVAICSVLQACSTGAKLSFEQPETGAYGRVVSPGSADSVWVYAYRDGQANFRGPADFAIRVDPDGRYLLDLLPGRWFLVARSRQHGPLTGPPQAGDGWAVYPHNPLILQVDQVARIDFKLQSGGSATLQRKGSLQQGDTGFTGTLLGPDSRPVAGAVALAYRDQDFRRMPDHSSVAVAADGRFLLYVSKPGEYCLAARQGNRGQPRQGELYGILGQGSAGCREIAKGQLLDVGELHLKPYLR